MTEWDLKDELKEGIPLDGYEKKSPIRRDSSPPGRIGTKDSEGEVNEWSFQTSKMEIRSNSISFIVT